MEATNLIEKTEVKRGGNAQYFIYMLIIFPFLIIIKMVNIPSNYLFIVFLPVILVLVFYMNKLTALVYTKVIIRADEQGIWTKNLQLVPLQQVKEIRLDITNGLYNISNHQSHKWIDLVIETNDGRKAVFWASFLNTNPQLLCDNLNQYLTNYK